MEIQNLKKNVTKFYVGTAIYACIDVLIRMEHGQGITEHIFNAMEYLSSIYQSTADSAMAITDNVKNGLSGKVNVLFDRTNTKTVLNAVEGVYISTVYFHGVCLLMKKLK